MSEKRPCRNCKEPYKVHIDYTFTEYMEGDLTDALTNALPNVRCTFYKAMNNLEYLEHVATHRDAE